MNPRDFHSVAVGMLNQSTPAHKRSAISRAYYAAFHVALNHLESIGFAFKRNDSCHAEVSRHLLWSGDPILVKIGSKLSDMRGIRNKADYRLDLREWGEHRTADIWVQASRACITQLDLSFDGVANHKIAEAIKANKKKAYGQA